MKVEKLLQKIEEDKKNELEKIKEKHLQEMEDLEKEGKRELEKIEEEKRKETEKERKRFLENYKREKEFFLKAEILKEKRDALKKAGENAKKELKELSPKEKALFFQKCLERIDDKTREDVDIFVGEKEESEVKNLCKDVFPKQSVKEKKDLPAYTVVVEGKNFVFKVNLEIEAEKLIEENENYFSKILFDN